MPAFLPRRRQVALALFLWISGAVVASGYEAVMTGGDAPGSAPSAMPRPALTLSGTEAIKRAVAAGAGVAVVSRLAVEDELAAGKLALLTARYPVAGGA